MVMRCPSCGLIHSKVRESRLINESSTMKRRRECTDCGFRFTTYEQIDAPPLFVVKRDGDRELFSRDKFLRGLNDACRKRPIKIEALEKFAHQTQFQIISQGTQEVESSALGEYAMDWLKEKDDVAYVRFASVYRQFDDVDGFIKEISQLKVASQNDVV